MNLALIDAVRKGGAWLGAARNWLLWHKDTGGRLTWGSDEAVQMTVRDCEEIALHAATAERERCAKVVEFPIPSLLEAAKKEDQSGWNSGFIKLQIHALETAAKKIRESSY